MITPTGYLGTLRVHWLTLFVLAVLGLIVGLLGQRMQPTEYTANRLLVVEAQGGESLTDLSQGASYAVSRAEALAYVGNTDNLLYEGLVRLGVDTSTAAQFQVQVGVPAKTTYIEINVKAPSPSVALALARASAEKLIAANMQFFSTTPKSEKPTVVVRDVTPVTVASQAWPVGLPQWLLPLAGVTLLPLIGFFFLVLRNAVRPTVGEAVDLDEILPFPILGTIPSTGDQRSEDVRAGTPHKIVVARYALIDPQDRGRVIALIGVGGRSDYRPALALAKALALMNHRAIVVDADFGEPSMDPMPGGGLATALESGGELSWDQRPTHDFSVRLLPTSQHRRATRLLLSPRAREAIDRLRKENDFVFLSGPSPFEGPEAAAIANLCDEVILTADKGTLVDLVVDAGRSFTEGKVTGLLLLDRGRPHFSMPGASVDTGDQGLP